MKEIDIKFCDLCGKVHRNSPEPFPPEPFRETCECDEKDIDDYFKRVWMESDISRAVSILRQYGYTVKKPKPVDRLNKLRTRTR